MEMTKEVGRESQLGARGSRSRGDEGCKGGGEGREEEIEEEGRKWREAKSKEG